MDKSSQSSATTNNLQIAVVGFSLSWLLAANLVGTLLACLLLWPQLNSWIQPFTYGRWIPLHLDWQLYGWCSLPLLGILCLRFLQHDLKGYQKTVICFTLWSAALLFAGSRWLSGDVSGKVFLNWNGTNGLIFALAQLAIWSYLAAGWLQQFKQRKELNEPLSSLIIKAIALLALLSVPYVLIQTSNPSVYPPVNPNSGGATGHSLLLSTLSLVFLMGILPGFILKLNSPNPKKRKWSTYFFWSLFSLSLLIYLFIDHGNASNQAPNQIFGLGTLLIWPGLVHWLWGRYEWNASSKPWRWAFLFWWVLLTFDGWLIFLPGILSIVKFTNVLVGHSHLAMAGMVTALNVIILIELGKSHRVQSLFSKRIPFLFWNVGCLIYVVSMTIQGWREGLSPSVLFSSDSATHLAFQIRLASGLLMVTANVIWLKSWATQKLLVRSATIGPSKQSSGEPVTQRHQFPEHA